MPNNYCSSCGTLIPEGSYTCPSCGKQTAQTTPSYYQSQGQSYNQQPQSYTQPQSSGYNQAQSSGYNQAQSYTQPQSYNQNTGYNQASSYNPAQQGIGFNTYQNSTPLTVGDYVGMILCMAVPILNLIMLIVWASDSNQNRKNFAKAQLIILAISVGISILFTIISMIIAGGIAATY